jgi:hypothetical protein
MKEDPFSEKIAIMTTPIEVVGEYRGVGQASRVSQ